MKLLILLLLAQWSPAAVRSWGHCNDVTSAACEVRDYWPRATRLTAVGQDAYWLQSSDGRVCFVDLDVYQRVYIGKTVDCIWRERAP